MQLQDDRTDEQKKTHTVLIGGKDKCMSGWGKAKGGISYAFWACKPEHADQVERWIRKRGDLFSIHYRNCTLPAGRGHCHIYVVNENHLALT